MLALMGLPFVLVFVGALYETVFPVIYWLHWGKVLEIYLVALGFGVIGAVLLYFARLSLYRAGKFWTVGPKHLDRVRRRLYWLAYIFVGVSVLMFLALKSRL